jgi:hypothetical protein
MATGVNLLARNRFRSVTLTDVSVFVDVSRERRTATILSARSLSKQAKPGEVIGVEVLLQPYRGEKTTKITHFVVPKDQPPGRMHLSVRGGTSLVGLQAAINQQKSAEASLLLRYDSNKTKTFGDEIEAFNKKDRNNDIVVDILVGGKNGGKGKGKAPGGKDGEYDPDEQDKQIEDFVQGTKYKTNNPSSYIVTGETTAAVEIVAEAQ